MKTNLFIFPCLLTETHFYLLHLILDSLNDLNANPQFRQLTTTINPNYNLSTSLLDLNEVIRCRNCKGYKYTSYILNLLIIKLSMIIDSDSFKDCDELDDSFLIIYNLIYLLDYIISSSRIDN